MEATGGVLARVKQPEYTGENRCMPCTVVNLVIATVGTVLVVAGVAAVASLPVAVGVGLAGFGLGVALIYLRGYLVPGTPELTKRYFPPWLLALFGKAPSQQAPRNPTEEAIDPEAELMAVGALEECADRDDLCLTDDFRRAWYAEIGRVEAADAGRDRLLDLLDLDDADVEILEFEDAFKATVDGQIVGTWESEAAMLADLGAANALADRHADWDVMSVTDRGRLLNGLRLFIDECPTCGGRPDFGTDTVESCCSTHEVAAVSCDNCGARLFESQPVSQMGAA
ncbi:hypothetical protein ACKVMT_02040 [Halobacteriales archaeon Cl-PHB]